MNELQKQILVGGLIGILICAATYISMGGKREDLDALTSAIAQLEQEVEKGKQYKANYEKLRKEVDAQNKQLDELIKLMPSELDRGELPIRLKKLADTAGMELTLFKAGGGSVNKDQYYTSYPYEFSYRAGFHDFGRFASLISGFDKMVNISGIQMRRTGGALYPITLNCTVTAFVYNPGDKPATAAPPPPPAPKPSKPSKGETKGEGD